MWQNDVRKTSCISNVYQTLHARFRNVPVVPIIIWLSIHIVRLVTWVLFVSALHVKIACVSNFSTGTYLKTRFHKMVVFSNLQAISSFQLYKTFVSILLVIQNWMWKGWKGLYNTNVGLGCSVSNMLYKSLPIKSHLSQNIADIYV